MKKILALVLTLTMSISLFNLNIFCRANSGEEINVLMVGNSLFSYHNVNSGVYAVSGKVLEAVCNDESAGNKNVNITPVTGTGATMFQFDPYYDDKFDDTLGHYSDDLEEVLSDTSTEYFDYVILNPSRRCSTLNENNEYTAFERDATRHLISLAQSKGSKVILCAQFGFNSDTITKYSLKAKTDDDGNFYYNNNGDLIFTQKTSSGKCSRSEQVAYNKSFCEQIAEIYSGVSIVPIGDSFEKAISDYSYSNYNYGIYSDLYSEDNVHYDAYGSYLESCCLYDAMFGTSCSGFKTSQSFIDEEAEYKMQTVADYCVLGISKSIVDMKVTLSNTSYLYDGQYKKPEVIIDGLVCGVDFKVSYKNNKKVGTAYAIITGKGEYGGTVMKSFSIKKSSIIGRRIGLSQSSYVYDGKYKKPKVTVEGLKQSTSFNVKYSNYKKVGTATVTVTGKNNFNGKEKQEYLILPEGTSLQKVSAGEKSVVVSWNKQAEQTKGYIIECATNKKFTRNCKTVVVSSNNSTSKTIKSLRSNRKYYIKVGTYSKVSGKKYYSSWSSIKKIKVK